MTTTPRSEVYTFTLAGAPRTKKTHNQLVSVKGRSVILPSKEYREWFKAAMSQAPGIRQALREAGADLPISVPVSVSALFYRHADVGDACGFYQALGDWLQQSRQRKGKTTRSGAGIISDDKLIADWDGSRLLVDGQQPRIEVTLRLLVPQQGHFEIEEV